MTTTPVSDLSSFLGPNPGAERIYDNIQATLPGVVLATVKLELWNAIEDFALRSTYFRATADWVMGAGVTSYDFNPYDETSQVCWILGQSGLAQWHVTPPGELVDDGSGVSPTGSRTGTALLALKPLSFDVTVPAELWSTWFETLLAGTRSRLYGQPAKPYTSAALQAQNLLTFNRGVARAKGIAEHNYGRHSGTWTFPYFARGRRR